eukprot:6861692-Prymnesium_polylepis.1
MLSAFAPHARMPRDDFMNTLSTYAMSMTSSRLHTYSTPYTEVRDNSARHFARSIGIQLYAQRVGKPWLRLERRSRSTGLRAP